MAGYNLKDIFKRDSDKIIVFSLFLSSIFIFIFWALALMFPSKFFWTTMKFNNSGLTIYTNLATNVYYIFSLIFFICISYLVMVGKLDKFIDKLLFINQKLFLLFVFIVCFSLVVLSFKITMGENWVTKMARSYFEVCPDCPWGAFVRKYATVNPLSGFIGYLAVKIGFFFKLSALSALRSLAKFSGIIYATLLYFFANKFYSKERLPFFILMFYMTSVVSFYGILGAVNFTAMVFLLAFYYTSYLYIKNKSGIFLPSFFAALTFMSHISTGFVMPALVYLILHNQISFKDGRILLSKNILKPISIAIIAIAIPYVLLYSYASHDMARYGLPLSSIGSGDFNLEAFIFWNSGAEYNFFSFSLVSEVASVMMHLTSFKFSFVVFAILFILLFYGRRIFGDPIFTFLLINVVFITFGLLVQYEGPYVPRVTAWESSMYAVIPYTMMVVYLLFDFMKNDIYRKRTTFLTILLVLITMTPWITVGFISPEIPTFPGTSSLTMTLFHGTAIGVIRDNKFNQNVPNINQGEIVVFLFPNLAGFRKNKLGLYESEVKLYQIKKNGEIFSTYFNPVDELIKDYPGRNFGIIPGNFMIPINSSSFPIGNMTLKMVIADKVSKAYIDNEYSFEVLKNRQI